jgi:hypothetical protein
MTQKQIEQAAQVDIRYFMVAYKECPTCGRKFEDMHPMENLYPHWTRTCRGGEPAPASGLSAATLEDLFFDAITEDRSAEENADPQTMGQRCRKYAAKVNALLGVAPPASDAQREAGYIAMLEKHLDECRARLADGRWPVDTAVASQPASGKEQP